MMFSWSESTKRSQTGQKIWAWSNSIAHSSILLSNSSCCHWSQLSKISLRMISLSSMSLSSSCASSSRTILLINCWDEKILEGKLKSTDVQSCWLSHLPLHGDVSRTIEGISTIFFHLGTASLKKQNKKINYVKAEKREQNLHHEASRGVWDFHSWESTHNSLLLSFARLWFEMLAI